MCPIPHPPNAPSQAAACLCHLRTSLTLVPLSVSLLLTVHVTVSAVTDQGLKGNLGEKVSAGHQPACAELRLSHCGWLCWCGWGRPESIAQSAQVSWFTSGRLQALFWRVLGVTFGRRFPQCLDYLSILVALWSFKTPQSRQRDVWNEAACNILPLQDTSKTIQMLCSH